MERTCEGLACQHYEYNDTQRNVFWSKDDFVKDIKEGASDSTSFQGNHECGICGAGLSKLSGNSAQR